MFKARLPAFLWLGLVLTSCAACATGCVPGRAQAALPSLSVHALTWLKELKHQDDAQSRRRVRTWSIDLQLSVAIADARQPVIAADALDTRETTRAVSALSPDIADADACEPPSLCEWARLAEEAALLALGVSQ